MNRLFAMAALSITVAAVATTPAQAWINNRFSIGMNWEYQAGNNNFLWGAFRNGQVPGPEFFGPGFGGGMPYGGMPFGATPPCPNCGPQAIPQPQVPQGHHHHSAAPQTPVFYPTGNEGGFHYYGW